MKSLKELYRIGYGPSSSHTMGVEYASLYIKEKYPDLIHTDCFLYESLAFTGKGHFTDVIIEKTLGDKVSVFFDFLTKTKHPNTLKFVSNTTSGIKVDEIESIGGGEIRINGELLESSKDVYPFKSFDEILSYSKNNQISLSEVVYYFEGNEIKEYLSLVLETMFESINNGLNSEGVLPGKLRVRRKAQDIFNNSTDERDKIISYAYAVSEENASLSKIVTAPTCGSCGVIPSVLYHYYNNGVSKDLLIDALAVGSLVGNVVKMNASISGADLGCQAEIGVACSMAAAMCAFIMEAQNNEIACAAEIALEHHLGLTCDPIDGLVQIPCIERNAVAALRALDAAKLSLLPIHPEKISLDMVINTMKETGKDISDKYKETGLGGLAANKIE